MYTLSILLMLSNVFLSPFPWFHGSCRGCARMWVHVCGCVCALRLWSSDENRLLPTCLNQHHISQSHTPLSARKRMWPCARVCRWLQSHKHRSHGAGMKEAHVKPWRETHIRKTGKKQWETCVEGKQRSRMMKTHGFQFSFVTLFQAFFNEVLNLSDCFSPHNYIH